MFTWIRPQPELSETDVDHGLRSLLYDGVFSQILASLTSGAFLIAFALKLGASNATIGLLAAVGPVAQVLQIPAILLVDKTRARKAIVVGTNAVGRLAWFVVAAIPLIFVVGGGEEATEGGSALTLLVAAMLVFFGLGAIGGCAFNSWVRDLVPEQRMGSYFSRRMALAITVGAVLSLAAGVGVDLYTARGGQAMHAYSILFAAGGLAGLVGLVFLARTPEPRMAPAPKESLLKVLAQPFRDPRFRRLMMFMGSWNFAVHFAGPFFMVYLLRRIGLPMTYILALAVGSQLVNVLFLKIWGKLADRFTNKSVLTVSGPLVLVTMLIWPFTTMPEVYVLTIPLLVLIHVLGGMSSAGVNLCVGNIALKAAPKGRATAYLATNSLVAGLAATLGPVTGGVAADLLSGVKLSASFTGETPSHIGHVPALHFEGLDFLFAIAFVLGLYALKRLGKIEEVGEVEEKVVLSELYSEVRQSMRATSSVAGLRHMAYFPYNMVRTAAGTAAGAAGTVARAVTGQSEQAELETPTEPPAEKPSEEDEESPAEPPAAPEPPETN